MDRLTRKKDQYECRIKDCGAENWMYGLFKKFPENPCENCPFEKVVNILADYEDNAERMEDDGK